MSVKWTKWAWDQKVDSTPQLTTLLALSFLADDRGQCSPFVTELCALTRLSERTLRRTLGELAERHLIVISRQTTVDGGNGANLYRLNALRQRDWLDVASPVAS